MSRNSKLRKPRSNADAASYWAEHLLLDTPCDYRNVNSICLSAGEIQSFGSHYPLAKCFRRDDGTVRRVVLTTSYYPSKGFASTPSDQWNVKAAVRGGRRTRPARRAEDPGSTTRRSRTTAPSASRSGPAPTTPSRPSGTELKSRRCSRRAGVVPVPSP
jgi:hypothetical protein